LTNRFRLLFTVLGVLPDETRLQVLQTFKDHWNREHKRVLAA
jgi:hypothetical protein